MADFRQKFRTFIAIPVPDAILSFLTDLQARLKTAGIQASWAGMGTQHLTLAFLGDRSPDEIRRIIHAMELTAGTGGAPFFLTAGGVGVFPSVKTARVIWCGIHGEIQVLDTVHQRLCRHLELEGIDVEARRFRPHLTLARIKKNVDPRQLIQVMQDCRDLVSERFCCSCIHLYTSELRRSGAVHTEICQKPV